MNIHHVLIIYTNILFYTSIKCLDYEPFAYDVPIIFNEEPNYLLNEANILFENQLLGPESLALAPNGSLYTGTSGGHIWRIDGNETTKIATIDGRPLGIRVDSKGNLYLIEANTGLYKIDQNLKVEKILGMDGNNAENFEPSKFVDDLVLVEGIGTDGGDVVFYTDVSTKFSLENVFYTVTEPDTTGRIIKYDINSKQVSVIVDNIWFPNGIEINDEKTAIIYCEFTRKRIIRYYISGDKKGLTEILVEGLPGEPDNIRRSKSIPETYWIGIAMARNQTSSTLYDSLSSYPLTRKIIFKTLHMLGSVIKLIGKYSNKQNLIDFGKDLETAHYFLFTELNNFPGMAIEIDSKGSIIKTLQSPDKKLGSLSEIREISSTSSNRILYLGSYGNPYLGKITLND